MSNKVLTAIGAATLLFLSLLIFRASVAPLFVFMLWAVAIVGVLVVMVVAGFWLHTMIERARLLSAERKAKDNEAKYISYTDGFGMVHLLNTVTEYVENLSTYPGSHHNGSWTDPHPAAATAWHALVGKARSESPVKMLEAPEQKPELDLITIMTQPTQSYAIIGGQQVGKTYQARKLANYWLEQNIKPLVVGPKWDRGEWGGCIKIGGSGDYGKVNAGMDAVKKLAKQRHSDKNLSHKQHEIQPVFFDDWTAIRANIDVEAESFIVDATTLYASVNIILYFIIHLDTANAWGVGKVGAALHQNFIKLFVEPGFLGSGLIDRSKNVGWLLMPGQSKKERQRIPLFNEYGRQSLQPAITGQIIDPLEAEVLRRYQQGESPTKIADDLLGHGGRQVARVKEIIGL